MSDDSFTLGGNALEKQQCSICKNRLIDHPDDPDKLLCTNCGHEYLPVKEAIEQEDEMVSVHEDEQVELGGINAGPALAVENDDHLMTPVYGRNSLRVRLAEGENMIDYQEEIPDI